MYNNKYRGYSTNSIEPRTRVKDGLVYLNRRVKGNFSQMSLWLESAKGLTPGAKMVYACLARHGGDQKGDKYCAFIFLATLSEELAIKERTCRKYTKALAKFGLIKIIQRGNGDSNEYWFLDHPIIPGYHESITPGTVLTAESKEREQDAASRYRESVILPEMQKIRAATNAAEKDDDDDEPFSL